MLAGISRYLRQHHIGLLALFIALGGTAWAIENNSVKSKHIVNDQVKSSDVKDDRLTGADIDESELDSLLGSPVVVRTTVIPAATLNGQGTTRPEDSSARCNEGEQLLGGGYGESTPSTTTTGLGHTYDVGFAGPGVVKPNPDFPGPGQAETLVERAEAGETPDAYRFWMEIEGNADNPAVTVYAICTT